MSDLLTPERVAELLREGVTLASVELLEEMEDRWSPLVSLRATRNGDGTWKLLVRRDLHCDRCGGIAPSWDSAP